MLTDDRGSVGTEQPDEQQSKLVEAGLKFEVQGVKGTAAEGDAVDSESDDDHESLESNCSVNRPSSGVNDARGTEVFTEVRTRGTGENRLRETFQEVTEKIQNKENVLKEEARNEIREVHLIDRSRADSQLLILHAKFNGYKSRVLLDPGCMVETIISRRFANEKGMIEFELEPEERFRLMYANGEPELVTRCVRGMLNCPGGYQLPVEAALGNITYDMILGKPWFAKENPNIDWKTNKVVFYGQMGKLKYEWNCVVLDRKPSEFKDLGMVTAKQMQRILRKPENARNSYILSVRPVNATFEVGSALEKTGNDELDELLQQFKDVFPEEFPKRMPPKREIDHRIDLLPDSSPHFQYSYRMSPKEMDEMKRVIGELCDLGYIRPSMSPWGAPVLFAPKADGTLRFCTDFRALNKMTIRNMFPLPRVDEMLDRTAGSKYYSKIDLWWAYWQVRIHEPDIPKTAMSTPLGHYEWLVLPFGLTNAPATFQTLVTNILAPYREFSEAYLDDILIFSRTKEDHMIHLKLILTKLREHMLVAKLKKCEFFKNEVHYLGHILCEGKLKPDPEKISAMKDWPTPKCRRDIQVFIGLLNYYRRFIKGFAQIALPLTKLMGSEIEFIWEAEQEKAFEDLKECMLKAPILHLPDSESPFRIECDASGFAIGAVLLQKKDRYWLPVAYVSRSLLDREKKYPPQEIEMLALVYALKKWRYYLFGFEIEAYTDHESLTLWQKYKDLAGRKARWAEILAEYPVKVIYKRGQANIVADALSRRPDHDSNVLSVNALVLNLPDRSYLDKVASSYESDNFFGALWRHYVLKTPISSEIVSIIAWYEYDENSKLIYLVRDTVLSPMSNEKRLCVGNDGELRKDIIRAFHSAESAAHTGFGKTYEKLRRLVYWPKMHNDIKQFVSTCDSCQRNKHRNKALAGPLQPLAIPRKRWTDVSMDFVNGLVKTRQGYDSLLVIVDRLTKMIILIPTYLEVTAEQTAKDYFEYVYNRFGLPERIVSDRDPRFTSAFWKELFSLCNTKLSMSTTAHPESDGQTERVNQTVEIALRHFVEATLADWDLHLASIEFALNDTISDSTGFSPFYLNYGYNPRSFASLELDSSEVQLETVSEFTDRLQANVSQARDAIHFAQTQQAKYANETRTFRNFEVGEKVLLSTANLKTRFRAKDLSKLQAPYCGPFEIVEKLSSVAYRLRLPEGWRIHDVFYIGLLVPYKDPMDEVPCPPPPELNDEGEEQHWAESILREKGKGRFRKYLVKWFGHQDIDSTWEIADSFDQEAPDLVSDFRKRILRQ